MDIDIEIEKKIEEIENVLSYIEKKVANIDETFTYIETKIKEIEELSEADG